MIRTLAKSTKLLGFLMLSAFLFQLSVAQAEHVGAIQCVSDSGQSDGNSKDQSTQPSHGCCSHVVAVSQQWDSVPSSELALRVSFSSFDETIPDGPTSAIDQPPKLA